MKKFARNTAFLLAFIAMTTGCESKEPENSQMSVAETTTTTTEITATTATEIPAEIPTETVSEITTETTSESTSEAPAEENTNYRPILDAYHQAYIDGNANAVYALFSQDEITAFETYMKTYLKENLGESEETVEKIFSKDNIVSAIDDSIRNIKSIMATYSESGADKWSIDIDETTIERYTKEELNEINSQLNIDITDGYMCEIPFYKNETNEEVFVAEPASVLLINGNWYISYSVACDRLIEFMDIEF